MQYSTPQEIKELNEKVGANPTFVFDMDGNVLEGYDLPKNVPLYPDELLETTEKQSFPFHMTGKDLDVAVSAGLAKKVLGAEKTMDVRLPTPMVAAINHYIEQGRYFTLCALTSREMSEARKILEASGVKKAEKVTLVADSGATLQINGENRLIRDITEGEKLFKDNLAQRAKSDDFSSALHEKLAESGYNTEGMPEPYIEEKGIALNVHYREIINHFGEDEGGQLDNILTPFIKNYFSDEIAAGPKDEKGNDVFGVLDGPMTVEFKITNITKGDGLEAITKALIEAGVNPSAIIFSGDDLCKDIGGHSGPGTDYFAAVRADELECDYEIPFFNVHTHHPVPGKSDTPRPERNPDLLPENMKLRVDLRVPHPADNCRFMIEALGLEGKEFEFSAIPSANPANVPSLEAK